YIIPKPVDPRLLVTVSPAVARAAMESGVARKPIQDWEAYESELYQRFGTGENLLRALITKAKQGPKRVVFAEAENLKVLKAAQIVRDEGIAVPILLGEESRIKELIQENELQLENVQIIDPRAKSSEAKRQEHGKLF